MNVAVIGLGSMGKRRIRLMRDMYPNYNIIGIDGRADRRKETEEKFHILCCEKLSMVDFGIDCVFVCASPLSHSSIINESLNRGCNVFTELNLVADGYESNTKLAESKGLLLFLSSTYFYREEMKYIHDKVAGGKRWNYVYHIGQYLPDWHPWENYKDFFLGDKRSNGCREILAIELPWIIGTFGDVMNYHVLSDRMTGLNIDYNDNFMIQLTHDGGNKGCLVVDVVSPYAARKLEIYTENSYLSWEGTPESFQEFNTDTKRLERVALTEKAEHVEGYQAFVAENAYRNEIREFFNVLLNGKRPIYSFEQDAKILELIDSLGA